MTARHLRDVIGILLKVYDVIYDTQSCRLKTLRSTALKRLALQRLLKFRNNNYIPEKFMYTILFNSVELTWCCCSLYCIKGKSKGLDTCYSAIYMSQTRDQQRFTISEVAADWHEPMVPPRIMWPSIGRGNGQLDPRCSKQTHHCPISQIFIP